VFIESDEDKLGTLTVAQFWKLSQAIASWGLDERDEGDRSSLERLFGSKVSDGGRLTVRARPGRSSALSVP
jgi:hypothetical protein